MYSIDIYTVCNHKYYKVHYTQNDTHKETNRINMYCHAKIII
jgi:hypothetical protein